jgi:hypothetical protein
MPAGNPMIASWPRIAAMPGLDREWHAAEAELIEVSKIAMNGSLASTDQAMRNRDVGRALRRFGLKEVPLR